MKTINLKDFYSWYTQDEFIEVTDEVAAELEADKIYEQTQERNKRRFNVQSLDDEDNGIKLIANCDPEIALEKKDQYCRLCRALNSLPETQGRRVEAHFLLGMSRKEIAAAENARKSSVNESIERGLREMKKVYYDDFLSSPCETH